MSKKKASISGTFMIFLIVLGVFVFLFLFKPSVLPVVGEFSPNFNFSFSFLPFIGQSGFNTDKINNQPLDELVPTSNLGDDITLSGVKDFDDIKSNLKEEGVVGMKHVGYIVRGTVIYLNAKKFNSSSFSDKEYTRTKGRWEQLSSQYDTHERGIVERENVEVTKLKLTGDSGQKFVYKFKVGRVTFFVRGDYSERNDAKVIFERIFDELEVYK